MEQGSEPDLGARWKLKNGSKVIGLNLNIKNTSGCMGLVVKSHAVGFQSQRTAANPTTYM
jgi:hypothetical protein